MNSILKIGGDEFAIHGYDFEYSTPDKAGMPAEQASTGRMRLCVNEEADTAESGNFKKARAALWKRALEAPQRTQANLREPILLTVRQTALQPGGERTFSFNGWISTYREHTVADQGVIEAVLFVWPRSGTYSPELK